LTALGSWPDICQGLYSFLASFYWGYFGDLQKSRFDAIFFLTRIECAWKPFLMASLITDAKGFGLKTAWEGWFQNSAT